MVMLLMMLLLLKIFVKNEGYIKRDKKKKACITEIAEIPLNKFYVDDFMRNKNCHYLAVDC